MKTFILYLIAAILYSLFFIHYSPVYAQGNALSLGVFPPILEITADPPAKIESTIIIQNQNERTQTLDILFKSFRLSSKGNGEIEYVHEGKIEGPDPLILQKIKVYDQENQVEKIVLEPFEVKELKLKINLEPQAPIGDYYFSVIFVSEDRFWANTSQAAVPAGIGTNVILSVGKKGETSGEIVELSSPLFVSEGPVLFTLLLQNNSPQYITPKGRITIKNIFGKEVGRLDILPQYILSNAKRYMIDLDQASPSAELEKIIERSPAKHPALIWPEKFLFGAYSATAKIKLSGTGPDFETSITFFALPLYVIFAISFFAFVLIGIYIRVRRKI